MSLLDVKINGEVKVSRRAAERIFPIYLFLFLSFYSLPRLLRRIGHIQDSNQPPQDSRPLGFRLFMRKEIQRAYFSFRPFVRETRSSGISEILAIVSVQVVVGDFHQVLLSLKEHINTLTMPAQR